MLMLILVPIGTPKPTMYLNVFVYKLESQHKLYTCIEYFYVLFILVPTGGSREYDEAQEAAEMDVRSNSTVT